ncbi:MAG: sn-glycerol-1-phosphate dehydrogenase [Oscillospiraceae bacterium]|nr:sn-glycerol-1-phosphate dehydrogenase [Oscillospiraceae bacterium]
MFVDSTAFSGECSCGRSHDMVTKAVVIESGALYRFEEYAEKFGMTEGKRCVLFDENTYAATADRHPDGEQILIMDPKDLHANEISTAWVLERLEDDVEVIIAVGSGTVHDVARFCAHERGIRFVSCPTGASVDGFCSTVAAMTWHGFKKTLPAVAPDFVIADTDIIKQAPPELVRSGVGDILAKYTALADWKMAHVLTGEYYCERIADITQQAADAVVASLSGILSGEAEAYERVTYALVMSGIAMQMMGNSRPASGSEHHVSHLIEMGPSSLDVRFQALHGEKTGVGSVVAVKEYKRLAETEDITSHVRDYKDVPSEVIRNYFGEKLADSIIAENAEDWLSVLTKEALTEKWPQVREIVASLPSAEEIYGMLEMIGAKRSLEEIGVTEEDTDAILTYSPLVRNRLTLMRVRRMLDL